MVRVATHDQAGFQRGTKVLLIAYQLPLRGLYHAICHLFKRLKAFGRVLLFKTLFRLYLGFILLFKTLLRHCVGFESVSRVLLSFATARMDKDLKKLRQLFSSVSALPIEIKHKKSLWLVLSDNICVIFSLQLYSNRSIWCKGRVK